MAAAQPQVYLSAVDEELHTLRDQVAQVLREMGYASAFVRHSQLLKEPGHRTGRIFTPKFWLDVTRGRALGRSAVMIQLVGHCYGITLQGRSLRHGPLGTLAAEAATARAVRKPVYYIVLSSSHPVDGGGSATPEMQARHEAYRGRVEALPPDHVFHSGSVEETLQIVKNLGGPLALSVKKARRKQSLTAWLVNISVVCSLLGQFLIVMEQKREREAVERKWQDRYAAGRARVQDMVTRQITGPQAQRPRWEYQARARYEAAVKPLAWQDNLREQWLRRSLRDDTAAVLEDAGASREARIDALHRAGFFLPGRDYAEPAFVAPAPYQGKAEAEEVLVWIEAAKFSLDCGYSNDAQAHLEKALALVDRDHDFLLWSAAQQVMGRVLWWQGQPAKALDLCRELVALRTAKLGPEHPDTLLSRHELGVVLFQLARYPESEEELRAVLALRQKVLGPEHADVLRTRMAVARAVGYQGHYFPAERELREVLQVQERTLGPLHPDTLSCDYGIAFWMYWLGRRESALPLAQKALTGMLQVHGNDHWETVTVRKLVRQLSPASPGNPAQAGAMMAEIPDLSR